MAGPHGTPPCPAEVNRRSPRAPQVIALGGVRVHVLRDGSFALDGGAMFGVVPRAVWERAHPADERNRIELGLNVALVESAGRRVLVDTGMGDRWGEKERALYRLDRTRTLLQGLAALGLRPEDIDVVVNTHLHFDHAGGNTREEGGRLVPTFPNARYVVQLGEWEDAVRPHERSRASYREGDFVPLAEARRLETVQGEVEVAPGVRVVPVGGHTAYHQMVVVEGGGETLVVPTDLLPTTSHLPLPWLMSYDLFPVGTLEAKRRLLEQAAERRWRILFYHDPATAVATVRREGQRCVVDQVIES
jgi:glyoxylase-like metal-dependent hydrolase (beta-lactamase superfamily II)